MKNFIFILLILISSDRGTNAQPIKKEVDTLIKKTENEIVVDTLMYKQPDPGNQKLKAAALQVKIIKFEALEAKKEAIELKQTLENSPNTVKEVKREIRKEQRQKEKEKNKY